MNINPETIDPMLVFAALSGAFEPAAALKPIASDLSEEQALSAATRLAQACDTNPAGAPGRWLIRTSIRHSVLELLGANGIAAGISKLLLGPREQETTDLICVLLDTGSLTQKIQSLIQQRGNARDLERFILALDRAGKSAPAFYLLQSARAAIAQLRRGERLEQLGRRGFVGRVQELEEIQQWVSRAPSGIVQCLFLHGGPGIGKSALLAEAVRRDSMHRHSLLLRLDFDRSGLDVQDQLGLTMEAVRQIAEQLDDGGGMLPQERLRAGSELGRSTFEKEGYVLRREFPFQLAAALAKGVRQSNRPVLVVLDTLEVLRSKGETHPESLFEWLDLLVRSGVTPLHVLAAGRGDALDTLSQIGERLDASQLQFRSAERVMTRPLLKLEDWAAVQLLERLNTPEHFIDQVLELAQGNPLKLRLGSEIVKRHGLRDLPSRPVGNQVDAAFLYRLLLSRIDDPELRMLAHPGLIVRRINADVIREVLAPTLGLGHISKEHAQNLFDHLASHHWLVEDDDVAPGFLKHRSDMRLLLLPMLYNTDAKKSARVDRAAQRWFSKISEPWAQLESAYHQLQLTRANAPMPIVPTDVAVQIDEDTLTELPREAADLVRRSRGERSSVLRNGGLAPSGYGDDFISEVLNLIQKRDWIEGEELIRGAVHHGSIDVVSPAADAVRAFLWRTGRWGVARRWLADRDRLVEGDQDLANLPRPLALARLEMRAEFDPRGLRQRWNSWRQHWEGLLRSAESSPDDVARRGALSIIALNLPEPAMSAGFNLREIDVAQAVQERWTQGPGALWKRAQDTGWRRMRDAGRIEAYGDVNGLATLTPYAALLRIKLRSNERAKIFEAASKVAEAILQEETLRDVLFSSRESRALLHEQRQDAIMWLVDIGLFADWSEAAGFVMRDTDVRLVGRAAQRWQRTVAGDWSYGPIPTSWAISPAARESRYEAVDRSLYPIGGSTHAYEIIEAWGRAFSTRRLLPQLLQRLPSAIRAAREEIHKDNPRPFEQIHRRLLARGAPAAFAPALAVLIGNREI